MDDVMDSIVACRSRPSGEPTGFAEDDSLAVVEVDEAVVEDDDDSRVGVGVDDDSGVFRDVAVAPGDGDDDIGTAAPSSGVSPSDNMLLLV
jgi:hypothetical protein